MRKLLLAAAAMLWPGLAGAQAIYLTAHVWEPTGRQRCEIEMTLNNHSNMYLDAVFLNVEIATGHDVHLILVNFQDIPQNGFRRTQNLVAAPCRMPFEMRVMRVTHCHAGRTSFTNCGEQIGGVFIRPDGSQGRFGRAVRP